VADWVYRPTTTLNLLTDSRPPASEHPFPVSRLRQWVSFRFRIPPKLSNKTLSLPCSQRSFTLTPPWFRCCSCTLQTRASSASSSSCSILWSSAVLWVDSGLWCCCFRRAARDQTLPFANPTPVAMADRYCHRRSRACSVSFSCLAQASMSRLET